MAWREGLQRPFRRRLRQAGQEPRSERQFPRRCRCFLPWAFVFKGPQKRRRQSGPQPAAAAAPVSQSPVSEQRHLHESRNSVCRKDLLGSVSSVPAPNSCAPLPGIQPSSHPAAPSHHPSPGELNQQSGRVLLPTHPHYLRRRGSGASGYRPRHAGAVEGARQ